jgi:hypothetical protein
VLRGAAPRSMSIQAVTSLNSQVIRTWIRQALPVSVKPVKISRAKSDARNKKSLIIKMNRQLFLDILKIKSKLPTSFSNISAILSASRNIKILFIFDNRDLISSDIWSPV